MLFDETEQTKWRRRKIAFLIGIFSVVFIFILLEIGLSFFIRITGHAPCHDFFSPQTFNHKVITRALGVLNKNLNYKMGIFPQKPIKIKGAWSDKPPSQKKLDCSLASKRYSQEDSKIDFGQGYTEEGFQVVDGVHSMRPNKNIPHSFKMDGKIIYDVNYLTDKFGRRTTFSGSLNPESFTLFLGGSFIFGEGLKYDETMPSQVAMLDKKMRAYNYGIPGHGIGNTYALVKQKNFKNEVPEKEGAVFMFFYDFDLLRLIPTFRNGSMGSIKDQTFLRFGKNDEIELTTANNDWGTSLRLFTYRLLIKSNLINFLNIDFPLPSKEDFRLYARAYADIKKMLERQLNIKRFYVVGYPSGVTSSYFPYIMPYLEAEKINFIDLSTWKIEELTTKEPWVTCDGHPRGVTNKIVAAELFTILKSNN